MVKFMPTGGINEKNLASYLELKQVIACGGSWMVNSKMIREGKFDEITKISQDATSITNAV